MSTENNPMKEMLEQSENLFNVPRRGQIIQGKVVQILNEGVVVNIGYKSDGIIPLNEISNSEITNIEEEIKEGQDIEVYVIKGDDGEGNVLLSKKRVEEKEDWNNLEKAHSNKETIEVVTREVVKGGIIAYYNEIRGFIPASLLSSSYVKDLNEYTNMTLKVKVVDFDKKTNKIVFSHKEIQKAILKEKKEQLWKTIEKDKLIEGTVRQLTNFGAFVDLGGVDGLIHISEISWGRIKHPSDVLKIGDKVEVYVEDVNAEKERISLSLRKTKINPWTNIDSSFSVGDITDGKVTKLVDFGAFIEIGPGLEGLVHISQISENHISKPSETLKAGQIVKVKVLDINKDDQRISLSIKEALSNEEVDDYKSDIEEKESTTIGDIIDYKDNN